jgi:hypothetical protein
MVPGGRYKAFIPEQSEPLHFIDPCFPPPFSPSKTIAPERCPMGPTPHSVPSLVYVAFFQGKAK